ncbi:MAG: hypothetical protein WBA67_00815 [Jannaschia sp.]
MKTMSVILSLALSGLAALPLSAQQMGAQQMAGFLPGSERVFAAGSVATFRSDGSYSFNHGNTV